MKISTKLMLAMAGFIIALWLTNIYEVLVELQPVLVRAQAEIRESAAKTAKAAKQVKEGVA